MIPQQPKTNNDATPHQVIAELPRTGVLAESSFSPGDPKNAAATTIPSPSSLMKVNEKKHLTYRAERILGTGAFGSVIQARVVETNETVCLKQVPMSSVERCKESGQPCEVLALHELGRRGGHPNIMKLHDAFVGKGVESSKTGNKIGDFYYFVMEYFPDTLARVLRHCRTYEFPSLNETQIVLYAYQLFRGLNYMHAMGYVHLDIKPQNVLINGQDNRLALCDFGCARRVYVDATTPRPYIQSRHYRAPEVLLGADRITCAADIWSAAAVVCEMILTFPLFHGAGPEEKNCTPGPGPNCSNYEMLHQIQKIIGSPTKDELEACNHNYAHYGEAKDNYIARHELKDLFADKVYPKNLDKLCDSILCYDPKKRPSAQKVLCNTVFVTHIWTNNKFLPTLQQIEGQQNVDGSGMGENYGQVVWPSTLFSYYSPEEWSTCSESTKKSLHVVQYSEEKQAWAAQKRECEKTLKEAKADSRKRAREENIEDSVE